MTEPDLYEAELACNEQGIEEKRERYANNLGEVIVVSDDRTVETQCCQRTRDEVFSTGTQAGLEVQRRRCKFCAE